MQLITKQVIEQFYVSNDGKFESKNADEVERYEKQQVLKASGHELLYKTTTQATWQEDDINYSEYYSEYYIYRCDSAVEMQAAVLDAGSRAGIHIPQNVLSKVGQGFIRPQFFAFRIHKDSVGHVEVQTDRAQVILTRIKCEINNIQSQVSRLTVDREAIESLIEEG